jgi:hypothetical protein
VPERQILTPEVLSDDFTIDLLRVDGPLGLNLNPAQFARRAGTGMIDLVPGVPDFAQFSLLLADTVMAYAPASGKTVVAPGLIIQTVKEAFSYVVLASGASRWHVLTAGGVKLDHTDPAYVIVITGQSNAAGSNAGGPNPASSMVQTWDGVTGNWGGSNYTGLPWSRAAPDGNSGMNNIALARAHRVQDNSGRKVFVVYDAVGGTSITEWVADGTASARYAALKVKVEAALANLGRTTVDEIIWAQGEEDFRSSFGTHLDNLILLRNQFRAESWCDYETPIYMTGPSNLHDRYMPQLALRYFCGSLDNRCIYVPSNGLRTAYDTLGVGAPIPGTGDFTHFLGESLWEMGYVRIAQARATESASDLFFGRSTGPASPADPTVIATFDTLLNWKSRSGGAGLSETFDGTGAQTAFTLDYRGTSIVLVAGTPKVTPTDWTLSGQVITFVVPPPNAINVVVVTYAASISAVAATGSIGWGYVAYPDGNYTYAFGYNVQTDNLCNYTIIAGCEISAGSLGDYGAAFGYQQSLISPYGFAAGRGHIIADDGGAAVGTFSRYVAGQADDVMFQVGIGGSTGSRGNGLTVRKSGTVEIYAPSTAADPEQNEEMTFRRLTNTTIRLSMRGTDGVVRGVTLTLA